jgi:hypothetical protein
MPQLSPEEIARMRGNQMPRGTGFAEQGGYNYPRQPYNSPPQDFIPRPMPPQMPPVMPQGTPIPRNPDSIGQTYRLSPEEIKMFNRYRHKQMMDKMFMQERMKGLLAE